MHLEHAVRKEGFCWWGQIAFVIIANEHVTYIFNIAIRCPVTDRLKMQMDRPKSFLTPKKTQTGTEASFDVLARKFDTALRRPYSALSIISEVLNVASQNI